MTDAIRDQNHVPVWMATSYLDGVTPVPIQINSSNRGVEINEILSIAFTPDSPEVAHRDHNHVHVMMGVSSVDGTPFPILADPATGAILIDIL